MRVRQLSSVGTVPTTPGTRLARIVQGTSTVRPREHDARIDRLVADDVLRGPVKTAAKPPWRGTRSACSFVGKASSASPRFKDHQLDTVVALNVLELIADVREAFRTTTACYTVGRRWCCPILMSWWRFFG